MESISGGVPPFCERCTDATVPEPAPSTYTINGIGTRFFGAGDPCMQCGSIVQRLFFSIGWIPIIPLNRYRIIEIRPESLFKSVQYVGRMIPRKPSDRPIDWTAVPQYAPVPASALSDHPELLNDRYRQAEAPGQFQSRWLTTGCDAM